MYTILQTIVFRVRSLGFIVHEIYACLHGVRGVREPQIAYSAEHPRPGFNGVYELISDPATAQVCTDLAGPIAWVVDLTYHASCSMVQVFSWA